MKRFEGFPERLIGVGGAIERPASAEQAQSAVVFGRDFKTESAGGFLRNRHARRRHPHPGSGLPKPAFFSASRAASRSPPLPISSSSNRPVVERRRAVDGFVAISKFAARSAPDDGSCCGRFYRARTAVGGQPRIAVRTTLASMSSSSKNSSSVPSQTEPPRGTMARRDGDDDRTGARRFALQLLDDAGKLATVCVKA